MEKETAISVNNVTKFFNVAHDKSTSLKQTALNTFKKKRFTKFKSVDDVNFEIKQGEFFGIIGRNGCGKSTLLKMIAGIYIPTSGKIKVNGSMAPFIELGVGFNPELTGRENVYLSGTILGLKRSEIENKFNTIIEFAELEEFIDQKLKNFSSGMQVRLAFSIAIQAQSDIMLIDEVLAVGDASFQKKCYNQFKQLKKEGRTIVFVSHDMASIMEFCDKVLVIDEGKQLALTDPDRAKLIYDELNAKNNISQINQTISSNRWGNGKVKINKVTITDENNKKTDIFKTGEKLRIKVVSSKPDKNQRIPIIVGLAFYSEDGINLSGPNSSKKTFYGGDTIEYVIPKLPLVEGTYKLTVAIVDKETKEPFDFIDKGFTFGVVSDKQYQGKTVVFGKWENNEKRT